MKNEKFQIELTESQLKILCETTDIVSRLYCGQVDELKKILGDNIYIDTFTKSMKKFGHNHGISHPETPSQAKILYDIHQSIRYYLAWKDQENTPETRDWKTQNKVDFDEPLHTSNEPLPKIFKK